MDFEKLKAYAARQVDGLLFVTVSGAHLYGFSSPDSDVDLRGTFAAPLTDVLSLDRLTETVEPKDIVDGLEIEMVVHEIAKYLRLLIKPNGYVLEQICSPIIVSTSDAHTELRDLALDGLSKGLYRHYHGFATGQLKEYMRAETKTVKRLLYLHRVLMTGIVVMREGIVEANLPRLCEMLGYDLSALIEAKRLEKSSFDGDDGVYLAQVDRLFGELEKARDGSALPSEVPNVRDINDFLLRVRLRRETRS